MNTPHSQPITLADAARQLGVCAKTLGRWIDKGKIGALVYPDGTRRIEQQDVDAYKARAYRPALSSRGATSPPPGGWRVAPVPPRRRRSA